jgi:hypothetical protein
MIQTMCRPSCAPPAVLLPLQHPPAGVHRSSGPGAGARPRARRGDHGLDSDNAQEYRVVGGRRRLARRWTRPGRARMALSGGWRRDASPAGCGRRWRAHRVRRAACGLPLSERSGHTVSRMRRANPRRRQRSASDDEEDGRVARPPLDVKSVGLVALD